jgi:TonB-dependent starch-binding outer membrane protein SusC
MHLAIMKRCALLLLAIFGFTALSLAQTVTGTVTDKKGEPLPGVTVTVKGTKNATSTNNSGVYTLNNVGSDAVLVFTGAGVTKQEIAVGGKTNVSASVEASVGNLSEVVVVGYGTRKVKDATGSVAAITAKDFNKGQISTPEQLFQGRTPGVTVSPSSGEPGAAATINIRGTAAIRGSQQPLYIVDGIPLDGGGTTGSAAGTEGTTTPKNPLAFINPNDIESISILKDASSAAIYGARGANGVIIITTKIGKGAKGSFNFGATTSVNSTASRYELLNAKDFIEGVIAQNIKLGKDPALARSDAEASLNKGFSTDWQDEIFRTAISQNYNLGWGFARNGTSLRLSASYDDQQGVIKNSYLKRITVRGNFSQTFLSNKKLKLEITTNYSNLKNSYAPNSNNAGYQGSLIGAAIRFNPTFPVIDTATGKYSINGDLRNPVAMLNYTDDKDNINRILASIALSYKITNDLVFKTSFGYDHASGVRRSFTDPRLENAGDNKMVIFGVDYGNGTGGNGRAVVNNDKSRNMVFENFLTYNKVFNSRHDINAVLGTSFQRSVIESDGDVYWGLNTPVVNPADVFTKDISSFKKTAASRVPDYQQSDLNSAFARINYTLDDKYLFTATGRVDGSSKFGKNNRYGFFPAFGAKWRISNEKFASGLKNTFSDFSLRANYGIIGSQDGLGAYSSQNLNKTWITSSPGATPVVYGTKIENQGNDNLKWEQATTTSIALDWATANRRFSGTIEYYNTDRKNLIFFGPVPGGFSATSFYYSNLPGIVNNKGLEVSLNYQVVKSEKFNWDVNYNMTFLSNKITGLPTQPVPTVFYTGEVNGPGLSGAYAQVIQNNYPLFSWYMLDFIALDKDGLPTYVKNEAGVNKLDVLNKSALPTFTAGLTNNFSFGRMSASIFINAVRGFYVYNNTANGHFLAGILKNGGNVASSVVASGENPLANGSPSTRFLEKGDFVRLSNVLISYDFKIKSKHIKSLTANISGQNLALFTSYTGLDPEVNVDKTRSNVPSRGFDYAAYPKSRTFSLGVNVGF